MVFTKKSTFFLYFFFNQKSQKETFFLFWLVKNAFQTRKVKFQQSKKNRHFAKGLVHGFCQKIDLFLICFFFQQKKGVKKHFLIFWSMLFRTQKKTSKNSKKNRHFPKGLVHGFCQKIDLFLICFFFAKSHKEIFFDILDRKKVLWTSKVKFSKSRKKSLFCKRVSPWFLSKNRPFFQMFFFEPKKPERNIL